jgi:alginate O-acetyltransferase complex protein AlgI
MGGHEKDAKYPSLSSRAICPALGAIRLDPRRDPGISGCCNGLRARPVQPSAPAFPEHPFACARTEKTEGATRVMLFCSQAFLVFFAVVFTLYWALPWHRIRIWLLLAASFYFYASWNKWLALIICVSTAMDYLVARGMDLSQKERRRKLLLGISLVANLGLLTYFKYANFFLHSLEDVLHGMGASSSMPVLKVILPIGISFYTFEAINYTIDVYRRKVRAENNLGNFMLFITFFPHLVAGPIVRARDFLPQIHRRKHWQWARIHLGLSYFVMGLFKKVAIADRMAAFADPIFANPQDFGTYATWIAAIAYALQIYCDFSGYTDMALGTAHLLGFKLAKNFNMPYLAANVQEFWHRWHISLSSWLRDYLFIPLGGSRGLSCQRCQERRTARNLMITMALGGLWHGAAWTFVLWGGLHGAYLIVQRKFRSFCTRRPVLDWILLTRPGTLFRMALTFLAVLVGWVFFRATTLSAALTILSRMFSQHRGMHTPLPEVGFYITLVLVVVCHLLAASGKWQTMARQLPAPVIGMGYAVAVTLALILTPDSGKAFIYFQF